LYVRPKKSLGQHFLRDTNIAQGIVELLSGHNAYRTVLELGPGTGVLTDFLLKRPDTDFRLIELDRESAAFLRKKYPSLASSLTEGDFLQMDLHVFSGGQPFGLIGNFPYNISSQIFFKVLDYKDLVPEVVCMLQKEVAQRIASPPGGRDYGILSVLLQAYYDIEYAFTVPPHVFEPPPKVQSGVIRLRRNAVAALPCDEVMFKRIVKQGFNNRRKTLRNSLKPLGIPPALQTDPLLDKRAEQLGVADFVHLTNSFDSLTPGPSPKERGVFRD
jgi:16S rRNA (adenine1518-N6/adenine1519-N6)-dimethyltransferase